MRTYWTPSCWSWSSVGPGAFTSWEGASTIEISGRRADGGRTATPLGAAGIVLWCLDEPPNAATVRPAAARMQTVAARHRIRDSRGTRQDNNVVPMRTPLKAALVACAMAAAAIGLAASGALAAGLPPADADCNANAQLTHHYTPSQLQTALNQMPADMKEYSNCFGVIQRQLLIELGKLHPKAGSGGGGGSFLPVWLIVVLGLLIAGAAGFGAVAVRNRRSVGGNRRGGGAGG